MKKSYKKPMMEVVPFELNEAVASGCKIDVYQNMSDASCDHTEKWNELEAIFGVQFTFTKDGECDTYLDGYCYFTSSEVVFAS